jgi:hypothetical protein
MRQNGFLRILIIVLVLFVVLFIVIASKYLNYGKTNNSGIPVAGGLALVTPRPEMKNWQMYKSKDGSYKFDYPENYTIEYDNQGGVYLKAPKGGRGIFIDFELKEKYPSKSMEAAPFKDFVIWNAKLLCDADMAGPFSEHVYCEKVISQSEFENESGYKVIKLYLNSIRQQLDKSGKWNTVEQKTVGPIYSMDASPLTGGKVQIFQIYYQDYFMPVSDGEDRVLLDMVNSINPVIGPNSKILNII